MIPFCPGYGGLQRPRVPMDAARGRGSGRGAAIPGGGRRAPRQGQAPAHAARRQTAHSHRHLNIQIRKHLFFIQMIFRVRRKTEANR